MSDTNGKDDDVVTDFDQTSGLSGTSGDSAPDAGAPAADVEPDSAGDSADADAGIDRAEGEWDDPGVTGLPVGEGMDLDAGGDGAPPDDDTR